MGAGESSVVAAVAFAVAVQLAVSLILFFWGRWVARRRGSAGWRRAAWTPLVGFGTAVLGVTLTVAGLVRAFGSVSDVDPADKARLLAQGISEAMNASGLFVAASALLYFASFVAYLVGTFLPRRGALPTAN